VPTAFPRRSARASISALPAPTVSTAALRITKKANKADVRKAGPTPNFSLLLLLPRRPDAQCSSEEFSARLHMSRALRYRCPCACRRPSRVGLRLPRPGLHCCQGELAPVRVPLVCARRHHASAAAASSRRVRLLLLPLAVQRACRWPSVVLLVAVWDHRLVR
jgi:hypothetical protein